MYCIVLIFVLIVYKNKQIRKINVYINVNEQRIKHFFNFQHDKLQNKRENSLFAIMSNENQKKNCANENIEIVSKCR